MCLMVVCDLTVLSRALVSVGMIGEEGVLVLRSVSSVV